MIEIRDLNKHYNGHHVLKDVSLDLREPGIYAVLGPNGSGKTTLLKSMIGLVIPEEGTVDICGKRISETHVYRNEVSYLPQIARFPENLRVRELLGLIKDIRGEQADESELLALFGLEKELKKRLRNLSGGTRQKVNMLLGFLFDTPVLILDEPTVSLDPVALGKFKKVITEKKAQGKIILYTTHIMSLVEEFSDQILILLDGKIVFRGDLQKLLKETGETKIELAVSHLVDTNGKNGTK